MTKQHVHSCGDGVVDSCPLKGVMCEECRSDFEKSSGPIDSAFKRIELSFIESQLHSLAILKKVS